MGKTRDQAGEFKPSALLGYPERVHILAVCGQREITPKEYEAEEGLDEGNSNYHFRALLNAAFLYVVREEQANGSRRRFYRARRQGIVSDEEFGELDLDKRKRFTLRTLGALFRRAHTSAKTGRFDRRANSHLTWDGGPLDQLGFDQAMAIQKTTFFSLQQVKEEAAARLAESGEEPIYTTWGQLGFESPPERQPPGGSGARFRPRRSD
jgi:hypothetical protein